jgi:DNA-binding response OmpR family regulator
MHQRSSDRIIGTHGDLTTNFLIVPIEEVPAPKPSDAASDQRPMVLVVARKPEVADELTETLNGDGYAAIATYDAETALETALLMPPDLAVIDARLAGSSGIGLAAPLRENLPECRIVMFDGDDSSSEVHASVNAAMNSWQ